MARRTKSEIRRDTRKHRLTRERRRERRAVLDAAFARWTAEAEAHQEKTGEGIYFPFGPPED